MSPRLRDYQNKAVLSVLQAKADGYRTIAGRMFTGGGKTVVFASIIQHLLPGRAMVLAHRQELIWQARDKIQWVTGQTVGVEMAEHKASIKQHDMFQPQDSVIVSTVQTLTTGGDGGGRIGKFNPMDFAILIIDEAHRAISPSYRRIVDYFLTNPNLIVLGVTATPDRADEKSMGQVFEMVPDDFDYDIRYGISNGWLVDIEVQSVRIEDLDYSKVRSNADDLNSADLSRVMTQEKPLYGIVDATLAIAGNRKGIGFSPSVEHARMTCDIFNRYKPGCAAFISGNTDIDERRRINSDFAKGKIRWIWNCGTHTEGFDDSGVEIIIPKPTESRALHEQMIGRGTRPIETIAGHLGNFPAPVLRRQLIARSVKPAMLVLDFYGNAGKHKLVNTFDILGGDMTPETVEAAMSFARANGGKPVKASNTLEEEEKRQEEIKKRKEADAALKANVIVGAKFKTTKIDPFNTLDVKPVVSRGWHEGKQLSPKQKQILIDAKFDPDKLDYAKSQQLIGMIIDRLKKKKCTFPQLELLIKCGWPKEEAKDFSRNQASAALDKAKSNGWRKPQGWKPIPERADIKAAQPANAMADGPIDDDVPF